MEFVQTDPAVGPPGVVKNTCSLCNFSCDSLYELFKHQSELLHHVKLEQQSRRCKHECTLCCKTMNSLKEYSVHTKDPSHLARCAGQFLPIRDSSRGRPRISPRVSKKSQRWPAVGMGPQRQGNGQMKWPPTPPGQRIGTGRAQNSRSGSCSSTMVDRLPVASRELATLAGSENLVSAVTSQTSLGDGNSSEPSSNKRKKKKSKGRKPAFKRQPPPASSSLYTRPGLPASDQRTVTGSAAAAHRPLTLADAVGKNAGVTSCRQPGLSASAAVVVNSESLGRPSSTRQNVALGLDRSALGNNASSSSGFAATTCPIASSGIGLRADGSSAGSCLPLVPQRHGRDSGRGATTDGESNNRLRPEQTAAAAAVVTTGVSVSAGCSAAGVEWEDGREVSASQPTTKPSLGLKGLRDSAVPTRATLARSRKEGIILQAVAAATSAGSGAKVLRVRSKPSQCISSLVSAALPTKDRLRLTTMLRRQQQAVATVHGALARRTFQLDYDDYCTGQQARLTTGDAATLPPALLADLDGVSLERLSREEELHLAALADVTLQPLRGRAVPAPVTSSDLDSSAVASVAGRGLASCSQSSGTGERATGHTAKARSSALSVKSEPPISRVGSMQTGFSPVPGPTCSRAEAGELPVPDSSRDSSEAKQPAECDLSDQATPVVAADRTVCSKLPACSATSSRPIDVAGIKPEPVDHGSRPSTGIDSSGGPGIRSWPAVVSSTTGGSASQDGGDSSPGVAQRLSFTPRLSENNGCGVGRSASGTTKRPQQQWGRQMQQRRAIKVSKMRSWRPSSCSSSWLSLAKRKRRADYIRESAAAASADIGGSDWVLTGAAGDSSAEANDVEVPGGCSAMVNLAGLRSSQVMPCCTPSTPDHARVGPSIGCCSGARTTEEKSGFQAAVETIVRNAGAADSMGTAISSGSATIDLLSMAPACMGTGGCVPGTARPSKAGANAELVSCRDSASHAPGAAVFADPCLVAPTIWAAGESDQAILLPTTDTSSMLADHVTLALATVQSSVCGAVQRQELQPAAAAVSPGLPLQPEQQPLQGGQQSPVARPLARPLVFSHSIPSPLATVCSQQPRAASGALQLAAPPSQLSSAEAAKAQTLRPQVAALPVTAVQRPQMLGGASEPTLAAGSLDHGPLSRLSSREALLPVHLPADPLAAQLPTAAVELHASSRSLPRPCGLASPSSISASLWLQPPARIVQASFNDRMAALVDLSQRQGKVCQALEHANAEMVRLRSEIERLQKALESHQHTNEQLSVVQIELERAKQDILKDFATMGDGARVAEVCLPSTHADDAADSRASRKRKPPADVSQSASNRKSPAAAAQSAPSKKSKLQHKGASDPSVQSDPGSLGGSVAAATVCSEPRALTVNAVPGSAAATGRASAAAKVLVKREPHPAVSCQQEPCDRSVARTACERHTAGESTNSAVELIVKLEPQSPASYGHPEDHVTTKTVARRPRYSDVATTANEYQQALSSDDALAQPAMGISTPAAAAVPATQLNCSSVLCAERTAATPAAADAAAGVARHAPAAAVAPTTFSSATPTTDAVKATATRSEDLPQLPLMQVLTEASDRPLVGSNAGDPSSVGRPLVARYVGSVTRVGSITSALNRPFVVVSETEFRSSASADEGDHAIGHGAVDRPRTFNRTEDLITATASSMDTSTKAFNDALDSDGCQDVVELQTTQCPTKNYLGHKGAVLDIIVRGGCLYTASLDGTVRKFELKTSKCLAVFSAGRQSAVKAVRVIGSVQQGYQLYAGSVDGCLTVFDAQTGEALEQHNLRSAVQCMCDAWGYLYIGLASGVVACFSSKISSLVSKFACSDQAISCLTTATEGGRRLICVGSLDQIVTLRDWQSGLRLYTLVLPGDLVPALLMVSEEEPLIYVAAKKSHILAFSLESGEQVLSLPQPCRGGWIKSAALLPGKRLLTASTDSYVRLIDLQKKAVINVYCGDPSNIMLTMCRHSNTFFTGDSAGHVVGQLLSTRCWPCEHPACSLTFGWRDHLHRHITIDHNKLDPVDGDHSRRVIAHESAFSIDFTAQHGASQSEHNDGHQEAPTVGHAAVTMAVNTHVPDASEQHASVHGILPASTKCDPRLK